jgi:NitT/TauT family transport system permease protein
MREFFPSAEAMRPGRYFSKWDLLTIPLMLTGIIWLTLAFEGASSPFNARTPDLAVSLDPVHLPYYALRSMFRMFLAVLFSLAFTFTYATLAAKSRRAEKVLIPILDFLQSLPILGFLTITTTIFLAVFRDSLLGLEAACIFAIFTSQVWNMTFSFYQSLITTPKELTEASAVLRLSRWQKFWRLEVPFAMPALVWNTMMSVSGGWFFVVAAEVITVIGRDRQQSLPGIGSYIALAIDEADKRAMIYAAVSLLVIIIVYDQLFFRPIVAWAEKFKFEQSMSQETAHSWVLTMLQRSRLMPRLAALPAPVLDRISLATSRRARPVKSPKEASALGRRGTKSFDAIWKLGLLIVSLGLAVFVAQYLFGPELGFANGQPLDPNPNLNVKFDTSVASAFARAGVPVGPDQTVYLSDVCAVSNGGQEPSTLLTAALASDGVSAPSALPAACAKSFVPRGKIAWGDVLHVAKLGLYTATRVIVMIALATLVWTPIGVWIGLRPHFAQFVQPLVQFAAAFPSNLIFPIAVVLIVRFALNPNVWTAPLMVLGTQWYILFNVVAGTVGIPNDLKEVARVSGLRGRAWWRKLILPGIFPAFVTGGITASGGSWNASIVAEVVSWGSTTLVSVGLGAYIAHWSTGRFNPHVGLGMLIMGTFVLAFNRLLWRRLYRLAEVRYRLD